MVFVRILVRMVSWLTEQSAIFYLYIYMWITILKKKKIMCLICSLVWWDSCKKGFYKIKMGFCKTTHILQLTLFLLVKQQLSLSPKLLEFMDLNRLVRMKSIWLMSEPLKKKKKKNYCVQCLVSLILRDDSLRDLTLWIQSLVLSPNMD